METRESTTGPACRLPQRMPGSILGGAGGGLWYPPGGGMVPMQNLPGMEAGQVSLEGDSTGP
eukprot:1177937-Prorocentrum_minimum.AAC.2